MRQRPECQSTILVVDDEYGVIQAIRETLWNSGHRLITTTDPIQALEILRSQSSIQLLITDLFMAGMDGATLLREGRKARPGLKIVLLTGVASPEEFDKWRRRGETVVLKPWMEEELVTAVTKGLEGSGGTLRSTI